jgi:tRNA pseudouridine55 synthase
MLPLLRGHGILIVLTEILRTGHQKACRAAGWVADEVVGRGLHQLHHHVTDLLGRAELAVLPRFLGPQMQTPPMYSAVKINGQPLYKLAREGVTVERKARPIEILDIRYGGSPVENEYVLTVRCSKGTYIRTLLEDIAAAMGQKGTMSALRRTTAGVYTEADAHTLEEIQAAKDAGPEALQALMLPVESVFERLPLLVAEPRVEQHLYNGCPTSRYPAADGRYRVRNAEGQFLGLANITGGVLKVEKLFVERNEKD